jgi:hypothetical protein
MSNLTYEKWRDDHMADAVRYQQYSKGITIEVNDLETGLGKKLIEIFGEGKNKIDPEMLKALAQDDNFTKLTKKAKQKKKAKAKGSRSLSDDLADALQTEVRRLNGGR